MKHGLTKAIILISVLWVFLGEMAPTYGQEKKGVTVSVDLSPAGSFEIQGSRYRGGKLQKDGGGFVVSDLRIKTKDLKTGLDLRDEHMRKRLGEEIILHNAKALGGEGKGVIEINKIKKEFQFTYAPTKDNKLIQAQFELKVSDFNISDVSYMGVGVKDTIRIKALMPISE
jgi:hypothetical protein